MWPSSRIAALVAMLSGCEPGTFDAPPPPAEGQPCNDHSDWGICVEDARSALVCVDSKWSKVSCAAHPCEHVPGQPTFAGRYWLRCGAAPATEGEGCARTGEVTPSARDASVQLTCIGKTWKNVPAVPGSAVAPSAR